MSGSTEWRTPSKFYNQMNCEFGFTLDGAASHENALHFRYCTKDGFFLKNRPGSKEPAEMISDHDGLSSSWASETVWCNPPYSPAPLLYSFIEKAAISAKQGALVVMLLNATTMDTRWFHRFIWDNVMHRPRERVELRILPGRLRFLRPDGTSAGSPRHGNMVVVFHPHEPAS